MSMDYIPTGSIIHRLHPFTKFIFLLISMIPTMVFIDPIMLMLAAIINCVLVWKIAKLPWDTLLGIAKVSILFTPVYILTGLIFIPHPAGAYVLFYLIPFLNYFPVSLESLIFVSGAPLKFFIVIAAYRLVPLTTSVPEQMRGLLRFKMPSSICLAYSLGMSMSPVMLSEARTIQEAQRARALKINYRNPIKKLKAMVPMVIPIASISVRRSGQLAVAIESRGFNYEAEKRTYFRELRFHTRDVIALVILVAAAAFEVWLDIYRFDLVNYTFTVNLIRAAFPQLPW